MALQEFVELFQASPMSWTMFIIFALFSLIQISPIKVNPWTYLSKIIGKRLCGDVMNKLDETKSEIIETINKNEADSCRYNILRFDDEIRHGQKHTFEHFSQIMDSIEDYEKYCREHPDYKNNKAVSAIKKIKKTYEDCKDDNSFL